MARGLVFGILAGAAYGFWQGTPQDVVNALLTGGADLNVRLNGRPLLHPAATKGDVAVATWLLDHGADIHAVVDCAVARDG